jgi:sialate O-acetylesterase
MTLDVWILAGQSNMQGLALLGDPAPTLDNRVEVFSSAGQWTDATEPLHRLWESYTPVHRQLERARLPRESALLTDAELAAREATSPVGAGLGPSFASRLADLTGSRIGLVPSAHGGTTLEQWSPVDDGQPASTLYGSMLDRARRALSRESTRLGGLLWYQGESDALPARSATYGEAFAAWIERLRRDLGRQDLPIITVQLGRFAGPVDPAVLDEAAWDDIRESERALPRRVSGTAVVSAIDLELCDPIHIGAAGLARLGRRMAVLAAEGVTGPVVEAVQVSGTTPNGYLTLRLRCSGVHGSWIDAPRLTGFGIGDRGGRRIPGLEVIDARAEGTSIRILTSAVAMRELAGAHLFYGRGLDPDCAAVDSADLPLPAFAPIEIR